MRTLFIASAISGLAIILTPILPAQVVAFNGSLADYLALDDEGVTIGDAIFSDFQILPLQEGASGFRTDFIDVVPLFDDLSAPGFRFDIMDGATADDFFELRFTFRAHGVFFDSAYLSLSTVNVRSDSNAGADVLLDLSPAGGQQGSLGNLFAFAAPGNVGDLSVDGAFPENDDLIIEFDAVLDGGGIGRPGEVVASLGSVEVRLGESENQPVVPILVRNLGHADANTFFIEFIAAASSNHVVKGAEDLTNGFAAEIPLTGGDARTDANGFARVEFDVSNLGDSHFFRIETSG